jgi:hypothetical protein
LNRIKHCTFYNNTSHNNKIRYIYLKCKHATCICLYSSTFIILLSKVKPKKTEPSCSSLIWWYTNFFRSQIHSIHGIACRIFSVYRIHLHLYIATIMAYIRCKACTSIQRITYIRSFLCIWDTQYLVYRRYINVGRSQIREFQWICDAFPCMTKDSRYYTICSDAYHYFAMSTW